VDVDVVQAQTVWSGIDLEAATSFRRRGRDLPEIEIIGRPLPDQSASRMSDDRNVRIVHGADDAPGLRLARKFEMRVDGGDDEVEARQDAVWQVERAVLQDVDLDSLQ